MTLAGAAPGRSGRQGERGKAGSGPGCCAGLGIPAPQRKQANRPAKLKQDLPSGRRPRRGRGGVDCRGPGQRKRPVPVRVHPRSRDRGREKARERLGTNLRTAVTQTGSLRGHDLTEAVERLDVPTLWIGGSEDEVLPELRRWHISHSWLPASWRCCRVAHTAYTSSATSRWSERSCPRPQTDRRRPRQ